MSDKRHHFKSRYIVDVILEKDYIQLVDSSHADYYIDVTNKILLKQFEVWFKKIFSKGINQFLLVFECHTAEHDGQVDIIIDKLINVNGEQS